MAVTGSYFRLDSLRDIPPGGEAFSSGHREKNKPEIIKKTIRFSPFPKKKVLFTVCLLLLFREYGIL